MKLGVGKIGAGFGAIAGGVPTVFSRLSGLWYLVGAVVIGLLLARWTWILFAPHTLSVLPAKSEGVGESSATLFGVAMQADAGKPAPDNAVMPNVRLVGVFSGKHGFAVLKVDEKRQLGVALGEEVAKGTKLVEIAADHIFLERGGVRQRVNLENKFVSGKGVAVARPLAPAPLNVEQAAAEWNKARQEIQQGQEASHGGE